ncbi:MAG: hypothetical protein H0V09_10520 [Gemmatimonadetes bacterium]|nr:hypothetical protein [Gemmatimonadota bacterium]
MLTSRWFPAAVLFPLALLAASERASGQEVQLVPFRQQEEIAPGSAARVFSTFQRAWSTKDAGRISNLVPADARASIVIDSRGVSSQMSRGQIEALLAGLFSEVEAARFDLATIHLTDETSAYAVGEWTYESSEPDRRKRETVFVVFRQTEPESWVLSELRIQPAR